MYINIITICYNNICGLKKTYNSILQQSYSNFNWIVIDGNSKDDSLKFLRQIETEAQLDLIYSSEPDMGIYDAMNKGIQKANGDYMIFLNAGDQFYSKQVLSNIFGGLKKKYSLIYGNYCRELKNNSYSLVKAKSIRYIFHSLPTSHQAFFYSVAMVSKIQLKYDTKYIVSSDYYFTSVFIKNNKIIESKDFLIVDEIISIFENNGWSSNNLSLIYKDAFDIQKEVFDLNIFVRIISYILKFIRNSVI